MTCLSAHDFPVHAKLRTLIFFIACSMSSIFPMTTGEGFSFSISNFRLLASSSYFLSKSEVATTPTTVDDVSAIADNLGADDC
jgi:hypothetical protein